MRTRDAALMIILLMILSSSVAIISEDTEAADELHPAYDTLTDIQKRAYDSINRGVSSYISNIPLSGLTLTEGWLVWDAFCSDHPEYFWFKQSYKLYYYTDTMMVSEIKADHLNIATIKTQKAQLDSVISDFSPSGKSYADTVREIHDWIILRVVYDNKVENSGNIYGTLVEGRARCEGYAYALNYMCMMYDIPSIYISGQVKGYDSNHAWNIIKMDDSRWYYMDVTWDDPKCPIDVEYDYFLIGSETKTPSGSFEDTRTADNDYGIETSKTAYEYDPYPGGKNFDCISLTESGVRANIGKTGNWYYQILDCKLFYDSISMQNIADAMRAESVEYWSFSVKKTPSERYTDTKNPTDFEIRMFFDSTEVTASYLDIAGHLELDLSNDAGSSLNTFRVYDSAGNLVSKTNSITIDETGVFTRVVTDFNIMDHPIMLAILLILAFLMILKFAMNSIRASRIRKGYRNPVGARICRQCGSIIPKEMDFCPRCGCGPKE